MIDLGRPWEPSVSHSLAISLKIGVLGRAGRSQAHVDLEEDAKTQVTAASTLSGVTGMTIGDLPGLYIKTLMSNSEKGVVVDKRRRETNTFTMSCMERSRRGRWEVEQ